jgi:hypothetical protein
MKSAPTRKRSSSKPRRESTRPEYDFKGGIRGKYAERYLKGTNVVLLEPEVAAAFPDSAAVNDALRGLLAIAKRAERRGNAGP